MNSASKYPDSKYLKISKTLNSILNEEVQFVNYFK